MITPEMVARIPIFASAAPADLATIASRAADLPLAEGEYVIQEGEAPSFFAILEGELAVFKRYGTSERQINTFRTTEFFGEVPLLLGSPAVISVRAAVPSRVMRLSANDFGELVRNCPAFRAGVTEKMFERVNRMQAAQADFMPKPVIVVGSREDARCHDTKDFLGRNHVPFVWVDVENAATSTLFAGGVAPGESLPVVIIDETTRCSAPDHRELAQQLGLQVAPKKATYDVVIVGAGPAGLAAAVYGASEGLSTLLVDRLATGGQAGTSSRIENYLGFPAGLSGDELSTRAWQQAHRFGAEIVVARTVEAIEPFVTGGPGARSDSSRSAPVLHAVVLDGGERILTSAIVLATGASWRRLDAPGVDQLVGRGIFYGGSPTDAIGTRGRAITLVGGGNSAGQAALFFASYASTVRILVRGPSLELTMSKYLCTRIAAASNITVETRREIVAVEGESHLTALVVRDVDTGVETTRPADVLFVFIGADANTGWLPAAIVRDSDGYICTGRDIRDLMAEGSVPWPLERDPYLLETSVPGIFAAGDVRHGSVKRVASGVGEGSMSIAFVHQYRASLERAGAVANASARTTADVTPSPSDRPAGVSPPAPSMGTAPAGGAPAVGAPAPA